uniref:Uncharacterized protein n=1 Tax=viral metagenome TaxID=1070528 RepID=A0A6C0KTR0_9ZZZZ
MSLAMYAAPFDNDINIVNKDDTLIGRKRANNKTQKRMPMSSSSPKENNYSEKVNSVLQTIHNLPPEEDEALADFNPPPPPQSSGVEQTKMRENEQGNGGIMGMFAGKPSQNTKPQFLNDYESGNQHYSGELGSGTASQDYQRFMPNYGEMYNKNTANSMPYSGSSIMTGGYAPSMMYGSGSGDKNDLLIEKMNYVIKLLEDQQDEKTGNVTEEVILYSFLGIFIIFIVDSFARVGKYTR